jgi:type IV pilus assembly protein PilW
MMTSPKDASMRMNRESGFTLVEMMVGVLVGLIATVVMFQVFAVSEGQKRTTTGAGDAQQSGLFSLFQMERHIRQAGFGLNLPSFLGCQTNGWNETGSNPFTLKLQPVDIVNGAGGAPDTLTVVVGSSDKLAAPERLRNPVLAATDVYVVNNRYGFFLGDVLVVGESGKPCTMSQVSALPGTSDIAHTTGSYVDADGNPQSTKYNGAAPGFPGTGYGAWVRATNLGGRIFNLGNSPTFVTYAIQANQLVAIDATNPASSVVIADGIVQMQAQYGFDGNNDGRLSSPTNMAVLDPAGGDQWADALPAVMPGTTMAQITAVRLAVVARSTTPERPDPVSGNCVTTLTGPRWFARDPAAAFTIDVSATGADWGCFRYRAFEVTIPLRNVAWFPEA